MIYHSEIPSQSSMPPKLGPHDRDRQSSFGKTSYRQSKKLSAVFTPPPDNAAETYQKRFSVRCCSAAKSLLAIHLGDYFNDVYASTRCRDIYFKDRQGLVHSLVIREHLGRSDNWQQPWCFRIWCDRGICQPRESILRQLGSTSWAGCGGPCSLRLTVSPHEIVKAAAWGVKYIAHQLSETRSLPRPPFQLDSNFGQVQSGYLWSAHAAEAADRYYAKRNQPKLFQGD